MRWTALGVLSPFQFKGCTSIPDRIILNRYVIHDVIRCDVKFIEILGLCLQSLSACFQYRRKGSELTSDLKNVVVDMFKNGSSIAEISRTLMKPYGTICGVLNKFKTLGSTENQPRSGRPCLVTKRDYRGLERTVKCNRRDSLVDTTNEFNEGRIRKVSERTVQYHLDLHKHGFKRRTNRKK